MEFADMTDAQLLNEYYQHHRQLNDPNFQADNRAVVGRLGEIGFILHERGVQVPALNDTITNYDQHQEQA